MRTVKRYETFLLSLTKTSLISKKSRNRGVEMKSRVLSPNPGVLLKKRAVLQDHAKKRGFEVTEKVLAS